MKMLFKTVIAAAAIAMVPAGAFAAAPCKDAHGKFVACHASAAKPAAAKPAAVKPAAVKPATKPAAATHVAAKPKPATTGTCRDAHGRFAKCGAPGTHKG